MRMVSNTIHVTIHDLNKTTYEGDATAVSSINEMGPFDILAQHENFISIIKTFVRVHQLDGKKVDFKIDSGVLKNHENQISIFLGVGLSGENV